MLLGFATGPSLNHVERQPVRSNQDENNYCGDGFQCGHHLGWFRVERGRAALYFLCTCQLDLATVSEFGSIERFRTPDTVQQVMSLGTSLV